MKKVLGWVLVLVLAALLGGLVGELLASLLAPGKLRDFCLAGWAMGGSPGTLDLKVLALTVGLRVKLTIFSALGAIVGGILYYRFK